MEAYNKFNRMLWRCIVVCSLLVVSQVVHSMSIEEAYRAIPHKNTLFLTDHSKLDFLTRMSLQKYFDLVNQAVVQRVQTLQWFASNGKQGEDYKVYHKEIETVLTALRRIKPPKDMKKPIGLAISAIQDQSAYFAQWSKKRDQGERFSFNSRDRLVQSSHRKLISAYNHLMSAYSFEASHNKSAFFDHLCALDFI